VLAVLLVAPAWPSGPVAAHDDPAHGGGAPDAYFDTLQEEIELRDAFEASKERSAQLALEILDFGVRIDQVQAELSAAEAELSAAEAEAARADRSLARTERQLLDEEDRLRRQAVDAYIGGGAAPTPDFMLALRDPAHLDDVATSRVYSEVVIADRKQIISRIGELREEAAALAEVATASREQAKALRDGVATRMADLERQRAERAAAQEQAEAAAADQQALAFEIELRRREYELRYAEVAFQSDSIALMLKERQKDQVPPLSTFGILLNPVKGGKVGSGYGPRLHPILGIVRMHAGIDISGPLGAPMRASGDGEVVMAEDRGGYGLTVVIDHGNQIATLYAHMNSFAVRPGDEVKRGDMIGTVGSTGLSTGPHCHWEVRVLGLPVDGKPYLSTSDE
jgi:murein DD-endopeptidase MepM/ murein hydrolase activator NlpD